MWRGLVWLGWFIGCIWLYFRWPDDVALSGYWISCLILAGCAHVVAGGRR